MTAGSVRSHNCNSLLLKRSDKKRKNCCFPFSRISQVKRDVPKNYRAICSLENNEAALCSITLNKIITSVTIILGWDVLSTSKVQASSLTGERHAPALLIAVPYHGSCRL